MRPDYTSIGDHARRRSDLLPQPARRATARRSPTWCTRRRCTTRIGWPVRVSPACCSAASARRRAIGDAPAAASRSGSARCRRGDRSDAAAPPCPTASPSTPELIAVLAPLVGMLLRTRQGSGERLMLRTNLSTRPFYNVRAVQVALGAGGIAVLGVHAVQRRPDRPPDVEPADARRAGRGGGSRGGAAARRGGADPRADRSEGAGGGRGRGARSQRHHRPAQRSRGPSSSRSSSTRCRRTCGSPRCSRGSSATAPSSSRSTVEARRVEDLDEFIEALETTGTFRDVLPTEEQTTEQEMIEAMIDGMYQASRGRPPQRQPRPLRRRRRRPRWGSERPRAPAR